jgi:hypothetical protein
LESLHHEYSSKARVPTPQEQPQDWESLYHENSPRNESLHHKDSPRTGSPFTTRIDPRTGNPFTTKIVLRTGSPYTTRTVSRNKSLSAQQEQSLDWESLHHDDNPRTRVLIPQGQPQDQESLHQDWTVPGLMSLHHKKSPRSGSGSPKISPGMGAPSPQGQSWG